MKFLLTTLLCAASITANSQILISLLFGDKLNSPNVEFGMEGGVNWSTISNLESNDYQGRFNLGFYFDFKLENQWYLNTGVLVKSSLGTGNLSLNDLNLTGASIYPEEGSYAQKLDYFLVPVLLKYKFQNRLYLSAGPQFGLLTKAAVVYSRKEGNTDVLIKETNTDYFKRIDMGPMVGLGYKLKEGPGLTLGLKYYYGLIYVYKEVPGTNNSSIFAHLNLPIGAGKKKVPAQD